jgi:hypothetical protein
MKNLTRRFVTLLLSAQLLIIPFTRLSAAIENLWSRAGDNSIKLKKNANGPFVLKQFLGLKDRMLILHTSHTSHTSHRSSSGTYVAPDTSDQTQDNSPIEQVAPRSAVPKPVIIETLLQSGKDAVTIGVPAKCKVIYTTDGTIPSATNGTIIATDTDLVIDETTTIKAVTIGSGNKFSALVTKVIKVGN